MIKELVKISQLFFVSGHQLKLSGKLKLNMKNLIQYIRIEIVNV